MKADQILSFLMLGAEEPDQSLMKTGNPQ